MPNGIISSSTTTRISVTSCTFSNCTNSIVLTNCQMAAICNNAFVNDSGIAIKTKTQDSTAIFGNVFVGCTTGIDHASAGEEFYIRASRNYWQGNTTKFTAADYDDVYNIMSDFDEDLASDPFTDKANDDLSLNGTAGADTLKAVTTVNTTDQQLTDIRPLKYLDTSGGGGSSSVFVIEE